MNAIIERWVRTCRRELLDRTLIWNQRHLLYALREFETFYNEHRPHQGIANARPLKPLPESINDPDRLARLAIRRRDRLGGVLREYGMPPELLGRLSRQAQRLAGVRDSALLQLRDDTGESELFSADGVFAATVDVPGPGGFA